MTWNRSESMWYSIYGLHCHDTHWNCATCEHKIGLGRIMILEKVKVRDAQSVVVRRSVAHEGDGEERSFLYMMSFYWLNQIFFFDLTSCTLVDCLLYRVVVPCWHIRHTSGGCSVRFNCKFLMMRTLKSRPCMRTELPSERHCLCVLCCIQRLQWLQHQDV